MALIHGMPLPAIDENYEIDQIQVNRVIAANSESHADLRKLGSAQPSPELLAKPTEQQHKAESY